MNLQEKNYGCVNNKPFTLQHTLEWKFQGLLMGRHNEVWNYHSIMETRAFSYYICDKPVISPCWYVTGTHSYQYLMDSKGQTNNITSGECFELNGWYLDMSSMATPDWHHNWCQGDVQRLKIIPVSHSGQHSKKKENKNKKKHLLPCLAQWNYFIPSLLMLVGYWGRRQTWFSNKLLGGSRKSGHIIPPRLKAIYTPT